MKNQSITKIIKTRRAAGIRTTKQQIEKIISVKKNRKKLNEPIASIAKTIGITTTSFRIERIESAKNAPEINVTEMRKKYNYRAQNWDYKSGIKWEYNKEADFSTYGGEYKGWKHIIHILTVPDVILISNGTIKYLRLGDYVKKNIIPPKGWNFTRDETGIKICKIDTLDCDYHPSLQDINRITGLRMARIAMQNYINRQRKVLKESINGVELCKYDVTLCKSHPWVSIKGSLKAGNCEIGTQKWLENALSILNVPKQYWNIVTEIPSWYALELSKKVDYIDRVRAAIRCS